MPPRKLPPPDPQWIAEVQRRFQFGRARGLHHVMAIMNEVRLTYAPGLSQAEFMATLGYSLAQWNNWFRAHDDGGNRNGPPFAVIQGIIHAYNVPPEVFDVDFTGRT